MAAAETAKLIASLELQDKFTPASNKALGSLGKLESKFSNLGKIASKGISSAAANLTKIGVAAGVAATVAVVGAVKAGISSLAELSQLQQQTAAVIASTGAKAGVTAGQVRDLAESLENVTTVDDKVIQGGENLLLTFTNIGAKVFPQATKAIVDMAIAMNNGSTENLDLKSTAIQVGKALQDPIKGIGALKRVGVAFTEQQFEQIVAMTKAGDIAGAQTIILKELETEFGNAGKAAGQDFGSDLRRVKDAVEGLEQSLARALMPVITRFAKFLNEKLADPRVQGAIVKLGDKLAEAGGKLLDFLNKVNWAAVADGLGKAKDSAVGLVKAFLDLPNDAKELIIGFAALNKLSGGAPVKIAVDFAKTALGAIFERGSSPANPMFVQGVGLGGPGTGPGSGPGKIGGLLLGLTGGAVVAAIASEFEDEIQGLAEDIHRSLNLPDLSLDLQWPFGPKNTPSLDFLKDTPLGDLSGLLGGDAGKLSPAGVAAAQAAQSFLATSPDKRDPLPADPELLQIARDAADSQLAIEASNRATEGLLRQNLNRPPPPTIVNTSFSARLVIDGRDVQSMTLRDQLSTQGISIGSSGTRGIIGF